MAQKLKIGMIGCGNISALYTDIYAQLTDIAQIVATADIDPTRAASRAAGLTTAYSAEAFRQEAMMHNAPGGRTRPMMLPANQPKTPGPQPAMRSAPMTATPHS